MDKESVSLNPLRRFASLKLCRIAVALSAAVALSVSLASSAAAAPAFDIELRRQAHEVQLVFVKATGGQFRLSIGSGGAGISETGNLDYNASAAAVQSALNALGNVKTSAGDGSVRVEAAFSTGQYFVVFSGGSLGNSDVPLLSGSDGTNPLSGPGSRVLAWTAIHSGTRRSDRRLDYTATIRNSGPDPTSGLVTAEVEAPGGAETEVLTGTTPGQTEPRTGGPGWACTAQAANGSQSAKAVCTRSDPLPSDASYPPIKVAIEPGSDAPNVAEVKAAVSGGSSASASQTDSFEFQPRKEFGIESFDSEVIDLDGDDYTEAGGHPFQGSISTYLTTRSFPSFPAVQTNFTLGNVKNVITDLPRGFVGNALAVPQLCPSLDAVMGSACPAGSAVGVVSVNIDSEFPVSMIRMPIFAIEPEYGAPVQFAFAELALIQTLFTLTPRLRPEDGYAISIDASPASISPALRGVNEATLCSFGARVSGNTFLGCKEASDVDANPKPLITNPTRCVGQPPTVRLKVDSWANAGVFKTAESVDPMPEECESVDFTPAVSLTPTNNQADTPTGLDVEITMPTEGLESPTGRAQAMLNNVVVTFPEGMSVNPSASHGLASCTPAQVKMGSNDPHKCPLASQVGTVEIETPLIQETLKGHVFLASQRNNPYDSMIGLYMVFASEKDGITIKIAGKLEADPVTGQLTSTFTENPEAPFSRAAIKFNSGPRAPLVNPPKCGTYAIHSELSPWSAADPANPTQEEIVAEDSVYQVTSGPNGAPCPQGNLAPRFEAGLQSPVAGSRSPFVLKLSRDDGTQRFTALDLKMPKGLVAYLKGVPYCPDSVLSSLTETELTGRPELSSPACSAASQIGTVQAGAGAGPYPFYAQGRAYLAGPYKGAPLSIAVVTPAVAGPFDLGNVLVRNAIYVDPVTAEVSAVSDPIPTMLHGLKLAVRDIRVNIDRPGFTAAPTSCEAQQVGVRIGGEGGASANLSNRFQVGECAALAFKPRISLQLFGGTTRAKYQGVRAVVRPRPGHANISGATVRFPTSAFVAQEHLNNICTRVQWANEACPKGSIYGRAEAISPLLDQPLKGNVHLRSSSNLLPDLVADLRGPAHQPIRVEVAIKNDAVKGALRNTVQTAPDAPVTYFRLQTFGGNKGLIVNSRNICKGSNNARATFSAHNGRRSVQVVPVRNAKCAKQRKAAKRKAAAAKRRALVEKRAVAKRSASLRD